MSDKNQYQLILLGRPHTVKRRLVLKNKNGERITSSSETPLEFYFGLANKKHFNDSVELFNHEELVLDNRQTVTELHKEAKREYPTLKAQKAYNAYSMTSYGKPYDKLIREAKDLLISEFEFYFSELDSKTIELSNPSPFQRSHISCSRDVIEKFKQLGNAGHVFSKHLAGVLLTTMYGEHDSKGVYYLLDAYENRFPRSLNALAEYLTYKQDYLGAVQCCLLSIDCHSSVDYCSRTLIRKVLAETSHILLRPSMTPVAHYILHNLLDKKFTAIAKKHFPEFFPTKAEKEKG